MGIPTQPDWVTQIRNKPFVDTRQYLTGSNTGGIQEAINFLGTGGGVVYVGAMATVSQSITFPASGSICIVGQGRSKKMVDRASSFTSGDLFYINGGNCVVQFSNIWVGNGFGFVSSGAAVRTNNRMVNTVFRNCTFTWGEYCLRSTNGAGLEVYDSLIGINDTTFRPMAGISVEGPTALVGPPISNVYLSNVQVLTAAKTDPNVVFFGVRLWNVDGAVLSNVTATGFTAFSLYGSDGNFVANIWMMNPSVDAAGARSLWIDTDSSVGSFVGNVQVVGGHLSGSLGQGVLIGHTGGTLSFSKVRISGCDIALNGLAGVGIACPVTGETTLLLANNNIVQNAFTNAAYSGVHAEAAVSGVVIEGNTISNTGGIGQQQYGINFVSTGSGVIEGNDLSTNATGPVNFGGAFTGVLQANKGIDDVIPSAVTSAATITIPANPTVRVSGTTNVTAINGGWIGRKVTLYKTDATSITVMGYTLAQNKSLVLTNVDGTNTGWF